MKHKSLFLIPLAACLILAGCGDDTTPKTSASETPASSATSSDVGSLPVSSEAPVSSSVAPKPATGVAIAEGATATVKKGKTLTLHATVTPDDADDKTVTWSSDNAAIASVSSAGVVAANAKGTAKITASSAVQGVKAEITITVIETTITISGDDSAYIGGEIQLTAATQNAEGTVAWSSSAPAIASVDQTGKVSALAEGDAVISAVVDGVTATKTVHVLAHKLDAAKLGLPASYKMEVSHTHEVEVERDGTKANPFSFHPDANSYGQFVAADDTFVNRGYYYRFSIVTPGVYRFYSYTVGGDTKISELYKYNDDGTLPNAYYSGFSACDDYSSSTYPDAPNYCGCNHDYYTEVNLEVGDYQMLVRGFSSTRVNAVLHIQLKDSATPVLPEGPADVLEVTDTFALYRVEGVGYYSASLNNGVVLKNGKAYGFNWIESENEYMQDKQEIAGYDFSSTAIDNMAAAGVATYLSTDEGNDFFSIGTASGFGKLIVDLLGVKDAGDFLIAANSTTGVISGASLEIDGVSCLVNVEPIQQFPVQVNDYPVTNGGEYDGGGEANQDW